MSEAPPELLGGVSADEFVRRARQVRSDPALINRLVAAATANEPVYPPSPHVERRIYDGFWSKADARKLEAFHAASWEDRVVIADDLEDDRLAWLARRLVFVERPDHLAPDRHAEMAGEIARRLMADAFDCGGWTTLPKASSDLMTLLPDLDHTAVEPFQRLGSYFAEVAVNAVRVSG